MKTNIFLLILFVGLSQACIKDDIIDDEVEPVLQIINGLDTIGMDTAFQFEAQYFNNVGNAETISVEWTSSAPEIIAINPNGLATGLMEGNATILVKGDNGNEILTDSVTVAVGASNVAEPMERSGLIRTTSSYVMTGNFTLSVIDDKLVIDIEDDYRASSALPGLFVYLTNNPNTTVGALEIGAVQVFSGAHSYELDNVNISDYNYLLYFCKPFNVKVGDGEIN